MAVSSLSLMSGSQQQVSQNSPLAISQQVVSVVAVILFQLELEQLPLRTLNGTTHRTDPRLWCYIHCSPQAHCLLTASFSLNQTFLLPLSEVFIQSQCCR